MKLCSTLEGLVLRVLCTVILSELDDLVQVSEVCQVTRSTEALVPVITEERSDTPWKKVNHDFDSFPDELITMLMVDSQLKYPGVELIESTAFHSINDSLEKVLVLFGLLEKKKTGNSPPGFQF
ncbi:hypothetical protein NDU88_006971 [Pleurodeles waltl]|uniref:Uncharacterized protein n=1 Tax=Pleurodeles waltl TaxID=8319 RepID=A0AAV7U245_PLEWA|nr:hypothetical protein NDU88_006971 [Pleurodeles waltl]